MTATSGTTSAQPAAAAGRAETRIAELDGVRGLAILLVLIWHYGVCTALPPQSTLSQLIVLPLSWSFAGVDLFFVLSGYLIGGILMRNRDKEGYFRVFYLRRAARLLPLYVLVLALFLLVRLVLAGSGAEAAHWLTGGENPPIPLWTYFVHLQNIYMGVLDRWGPHGLAMTWSLAVEEQFYLLAPILVFVLPRRLLPHLLMGLVVSAPVLRAVLVHNGAPSLASYTLLPCRWDSLAAGMLLAWALAEPRIGGWLKSRPEMLSKASMWLLIGCGVLIANGMLANMPATVIYGHSYIAITAAALILAALHGRDGKLRAFMAWRPLRALGVVSYAVYMLHQPMQGLVHLAITGKAPSFDGVGDAGVALLALALTLAAAAASWRWLETPLIALGHRARYGTRPLSRWLGAPGRPALAPGE